ncbi:MAG: glutamine amidotransferase [Verrucomicrobiota bacterium]|nr:glutamine amidotransferase [Verrucomicrobiota bacterium]
MSEYGSIVFLSREWLPVVMGVAVLVILVSLWGYRRTRLPMRLKLAGITLKTLGIALLCFCLLEPQWMRERAKQGANIVAVLADNSQGMSIRDARSTTSRGEEMAEALKPEPGGWQEALDENFVIKRYTFDTRRRWTDDFASLDFKGRASSLIEVTRQLGEDFSGQPLAGILLFSDGIATDHESLDNGLGPLPPIYPVVMGRESDIRDISITNLVQVSSPFEDAPVSIHCDISVTGFRSGDQIEVRLFDLDGTLIETQSPVVAQSKSMNIKFEVKPEALGVSFYTVEVGQVKQPEGQLVEEEATLANNRRMVAVKRRREPYRILYVAGRPNWEYKFLKRALDDDPQIDLVGLIRIAKREPRFVFLGRGGESSNPLFKGFGGDDEGERYDKPILKRLNVRDEDELKDDFPKSAAELFGYDAIILDDLESAFFMPHQRELIRRHVSERGGGFMMLGGQESFTQGGYENTPIAELLPVYLQRRGEVTPVDKLEYKLEREGRLSRWMRLRKTEADEEDRLEDMPKFRVLNQVDRIKPGATVMASMIDGNGDKLPALVVQRYGHGKSAALLVGDMWRWQMAGDGKREDLPRAWRQIIRWLVAEVPNRVELDIEASGQHRKLIVRARDGEFKPLGFANVELSVMPDGDESKAVDLPVEPAGTKTGVSEIGAFESSYKLGEEGGYVALAKVRDEDGKVIGEVEDGWTSNPAAEEFGSLQPNFALMENLAERTGGRVLTVSELAKWAKELPMKKADVTEPFATTLWHLPWMFAAALLLLVTEWWLRRRHWLP